MQSLYELVKIRTSIKSQDEQTIETFISLLKSKPPLQLEEFQTIRFEEFTDTMQQQMLNLMLMRRAPLEATRLLLDRMQSINYGNSGYSTYEDNNPLLFCCYNGLLDRVKLLVENYGADIEHMDFNGKTGIMLSAANGYLYIVEYLYKKGAKTTANLGDYNDNIEKLIGKWDAERDSINNKRLVQELISKCDQLQLENESIREENLALKQKQTTILEFIGSI